MILGPIGVRMSKVSPVYPNVAICKELKKVG